MNKKDHSAKRSALTAELLREHLDYDQATGVFTWKRRRWRSAKGVAGCLSKKGYVVIVIDDIQYSAHHLAWLYVYGAWPERELDHRDTDRANNRIRNLREATQSQNNGNMRRPPRNTSGFKGVRRKTSGRWEASLNSQGKFYYLGTHDSPEKASAAYIAKARVIFGEFARAA